MEPEVSMVVLSHDHLPYTARLLQTLALTRGPSFETVLIDNGSAPEVTAALGEWARSEAGTRLGLRCIFNDGNRGVASGRNQGAALARGRRLLFLDNDTEVIDPDWLARLLDAARAAPDAGAVGAALLNPNGTVQFVGGSVDASGRAAFWTDPRPADDAGDVGSTVFALGACLLTP